MKMNFFSRFFGTFSDPGRTFAGLAEKPIWVDALVVILIVGAIFSYLIAPYMQKDSLQMMEDNAAKLKQKWGEEGYNRAIQRTKSTSSTRLLINAAVVSPMTLLIGLLLSALIVFGLSRMVSTEGNYLKVFSVLVHANFVDKILGNALRLLLIFNKKSVFQTSTSLAAFFPKLEVTSLPYVVLGQFDFFQLWLFGIFGLGLAAIFKINLKKALFISYAFWLIKSVFNVAITLLFMSYLR
jgi:Yip1 domain